jgi:hypothetical protein
MSYSYGIPGTRVVAYTYEAAYHCVDCARNCFGQDEHGFVPESARDSEGNEIGAAFTSDLDVETVETCDTCLKVICMCCGVVAGERASGQPCFNCSTEWRVQA